MNKKFTKTIILIVFVVFLGITRVEAKSKVCIYKDGDRTNKIEIDDSFSSADLQKGSYAHGRVENWSSSNGTGFTAYDYFEANGRTCPPYLVERRDVFANEVYFADDDTLSKVKKYARESKWIKRKIYVYDLASEKNGDGMRGDASNNNSVTTITSKTCSCSGKDKGKKLSVTMKVSDNLSKPRITVKFGDATNDEPILNWDEPLETMDGFSKKKTTYTFMDALIENNQCPDYAILYKGNGKLGSYGLVVSDKDNLSEVEDALKEYKTGNGNIYTVGCQETVIDNTPTTSNKPQTSNEYDDPTINSNVTPLSPNFDTYSCGGSYLTGIPTRIPKLTKFIYIFLQILVPIAIIILGSLDLLKAVGGQKEDEIKKGQQVFIKRLVGAAIVFFVFAIVKFAISLVSDNSTSIINCMDCFLKNNDSCVKE